MNRKQINLQNDEKIKLLPTFEDTHGFIRNNLERTNAFVHCQAGVSRSATLVIAFLMKEQRWSR